MIFKIRNLIYLRVLLRLKSVVNGWKYIIKNETFVAFANNPKQTHARQGAGSGLLATSLIIQFPHIKINNLKI